MTTATTATAAGADVIETGYDADNCCRDCGEHIADPHAPECPRG